MVNDSSPHILLS